MICNRCGQEKKPDTIGQALALFVCSVCRMDKAGWHFKETLEIRDTERSENETTNN